MELVTTTFTVKLTRFELIVLWAALSDRISAGYTDCSYTTEKKLIDDIKHMLFDNNDKGAKLCQIG